MAKDISTQYRYSGKGPFDAKQLVKTYTDLISEATWLSDSGSMIAYNGMIVAVWLDKNEDKSLSDKNGVYFLFDPAVTSTIKKPDVTNEANWHKLGGINDLPGLSDQLDNLQQELDTVKSEIDELQESATEVVETFEQLPNQGKPGKLYIVTADATTYVWYNDKYLLVGDGADESDIQIIHGGSAR